MGGDHWLAPYGGLELGTRGPAETGTVAALQNVLALKKKGQG